MNIELAQALASNAVDLASELEYKAQELQCTLRILGCNPDQLATASFIVAKAHSLKHYATVIGDDLETQTEQEATDDTGINIDDYRCQFKAGGQYVAIRDNEPVLFTVLSRRSFVPHQWEATISYGTVTDVVPVSISVSTFLCGRSTEYLRFKHEGHMYDASSTSFCRYIG